MAGSNHEVVGHKILRVRPMSKAELKSEGWEGRWSTPVVLVLDNGTKLYASRDDEGNGPGALFGEDPTGSKFVLP